MLTACALGMAGLYMTWIRGSIGDLSQHIGGSLGAVLIWLCAAMALRYAMAAISKLIAAGPFLVASAAWFYRIAFVLSLLLFKGPFGFDPVTFTGPFPIIMSFAQYLFPLAILEIYLRAQDRPGALRRMATAGILFVLTLAMGVSSRRSPVRQRSNPLPAVRPFVRAGYLVWWGERVENENRFRVQPT